MAHLELWLDRLDGLNRAVGRAVAWLLLGTVLVVFAVVILRYGFGWGRIWLQEGYVWLHAAAFMLGAAYTLSADAHVRIDLIYAQRGPRYRALVDLFGTLCLLMPFMLVLLATSLPYVGQSWRIGETSRDAGGLPALYLLKTVIPVFAVMLILQGLVVIGRSALVLATHKGQEQPPPEPPGF